MSEAGIEPSDGSQYHFDPGTYDELIAEVPLYERLQEESIAAIPFAPERVLELGIGTGETTRRLLERHPDAQILGLDSTPGMVFKARQLPIEVQLARMEDPLPDGPWDLVISVLAVHHLTDEQKQDLFRRIRETSRAMVIGDVVAVPEAERRTPLTPDFDRPCTLEQLVEWSGGEPTWSDGDLAVVSATF